MPLLVTEVASGAGESASSERGGSLTRVFKIALSSPGESVNIESACGVFVGSRIGDLVCASYDSRYDGESRMVLVVTFQYETPQPQTPGGGGGDNKDRPPETRPANWSISSSTIEQPVLSWRPLEDVAGLANVAKWGAAEPADNPVGDVYDGVVKLVPVVNIAVSQWEQTDPTRHATLVGHINEKEVRIGSLTIKPHQLLFTSLESSAVAENYGGSISRGWRVQYNFAYKRNTTIIDLPKGGPGGAPKRQVSVDIGWDIAVPQTGFNVLSFDPQAGIRADQDVFGQPLRHGKRETEDYAQIIPPARGGYLLSEGLAAGDKARAMVRVFSYSNGGSSQAPSAQPIPLNDDGTPRKLKLDGPEADRILPIVYAYQVYDAEDLAARLALRLE